MSSRTDQLNTILRSLQSGSPEIEASALVSEDGLMIASALPQHIDEVRVAGMSATLISLGTRAVSELDMGSMEQVLIRGEKGYAVMVKATEGTDLLVLTTAEAKLGMVFLDMSRAVSEIKKVL
ncbi:MAG: roadblock/LC7 domain-containing protein [Myxococcota bacterium]|nr:roadblock/LC7 domain-containing protein [Myxococcota bacterium]